MQAIKEFVTLTVFTDDRNVVITTLLSLLSYVISVKRVVWIVMFQI